MAPTPCIPPLTQCFPGQAKVQTVDGPKSMQQLTVKDKLLTGFDNRGNAVYEEFWWGSKSANHSARFTSIVTESGHVMCLTPNHLIPLLEQGQQLNHIDVGQFMQSAHKAKVGQCVIITEGNGHSLARICSVGEVYMCGLYSPLTASGRIVVDGIVASCYLDDGGVGEEPEVIEASNQPINTGVAVHN